MARPGRPRKVDAPRSNGRIRYEQNRDYGTPELQLTRLTMAKGADPVMTTNPLDLLLVRSVITEDQHKAGMDFARAYRRVHKVHPRIMDPNRTDKGMDPEPTGKDVNAEAFLGRALKALKTISRQHYDAVVNVAVYERLSFPVPPIHAKHRSQCIKLIEGLQALMQRQRRAA